MERKKRGRKMGGNLRGRKKPTYLVLFPALLKGDLGLVNGGVVVSLAGLIHGSMVLPLAAAESPSRSILVTVVGVLEAIAPVVVAVAVDAMSLLRCNREYNGRIISRWVAAIN